MTANLIIPRWRRRKPGLNPAAPAPSPRPSTISELTDVNKNKAATEDAGHVYTSILPAWGLSTAEAQWVHPAFNHNHRVRFSPSTTSWKWLVFRLGNLIFRGAQKWVSRAGFESQNSKIHNIPLWLSRAFIAWMTELILHSSAASVQQQLHSDKNMSFILSDLRARRSRNVSCVKEKQDWWCTGFFYTALESINQPQGCRKQPRDCRRSQTFESVAAAAQHCSGPKQSMHISWVRIRPGEKHAERVTKQMVSHVGMR